MQYSSPWHVYWDYTVLNTIHKWSEPSRWRTQQLVVGAMILPFSPFCISSLPCPFLSRNDTPLKSS